MKKLKLCLVLLPMFAISCSDEQASAKTETAQTASGLKTLGLGAENPENPYDKTGIYFGEILDALYQSGLKPESVSHAAVLIDSVANSYPELDLLSSDNFLHHRLDEITAIVNSNNSIEDILLSSTLTQEAQSSFAELARSLDLHSEDSFEDLYAIIVSYEENVLYDTNLCREDKQIILITSSVVRHSLERKRKDKDWETSVTKMAETVFANSDDAVLGVKMALTVGICEKHKISQ